MKAIAIVMTAAGLIFAAATADAQQRAVSSGARVTFPSHSNRFSWERGHRFHGGIGGVWIVEREVPVIVEREPPPPPAPPVLACPPDRLCASLPLPQKSGGGEQRKPYVIGSTYASLPDSCMKLIDGGVSYYYCDGEWYRQIGGGRGARYQAVARKL